MRLLWRDRAPRGFHAPDRFITEQEKETIEMKTKKISVRRTGDIRLTTAALCNDTAYWVQV
jgi:hypothetical protein